MMKRKVAQVFSKVEGWIEKLFVNYTGKLVEKGQPLFTLYSPDLVATQEEYLLALKAKESLGLQLPQRDPRGIGVAFGSVAPPAQSLGYFR